jgi:hypothetical protein
MEMTNEIIMYMSWVWLVVLHKMLWIQFNKNKKFISKIMRDTETRKYIIWKEFCVELRRKQSIHITFTCITCIRVLVLVNRFKIIQVSELTLSWSRHERDIGGFLLRSSNWCQALFWKGIVISTLNQSKLK